MEPRIIRTLLIDPVVLTVTEKWLNPSGKKLREILGGKPESVYLGTLIPGHSLWLLDEEEWPKSAINRPRHHGLPLWGFSGPDGALDVPMFGYAIVHGMCKSVPTNTALLPEQLEKYISWPNA